MAVFVGSPSYRNQIGYGFGRVFITAVMVALIVWWGIMARMATERPSPLGVSSLFRFSVMAVIFLIAMFFALRSLSARGRKSHLEKAVDRELGALPEGYAVFCGRPWTGETAARPMPKSKGATGEWTLTDSHGRTMNQQTPHRVILGPSGIWFLVVAPMIASAELAAVKAQARNQALALGAFIQQASAETISTQGSRPVHVLVFDRKSGVLHDENGPDAHRLSDLSRLVSSAPTVLADEARSVFAAALASCYPGSEVPASMRTS